MLYIGDWGLGIGDWGLGIGPNPQYPITNAQTPIPKPQIATYINTLNLNFLIKLNNNFELYI